MTKKLGWKWDDLSPRKRAAALAAVVAASALALPVAANADEQPEGEWHPVDVIYVGEAGTVIEVGANPHDIVVDGWSWDGT